MKRAALLALIALLALVGCTSTSNVQVDIASPTPNTAQATMYFSIVRGSAQPEIADVETWTVTPLDTGFDLYLSSALSDLTVRLFNIPYDVAPGAYVIVAEPAEVGITADVIETSTETLRYRAANGTLTITEAEETLAGSFDFAAVPAAIEPDAAGPITINGTFAGIDPVTTSALD